MHSALSALIANLALLPYNAKTKQPLVHVLLVVLIVRMDFVFNAELAINKLGQLVCYATLPTVLPAPLKTSVIFALDSMYLPMEAVCLKLAKQDINPRMDFAPLVIRAVPVAQILSVVVAVSKASTQ